MIFARKNIVSFFSILLFLFFIFLFRFYSLNIFYDLSQVIIIVLGFFIFLVIWNSRYLIKNNFYLFLGVSFLFVGLLDFLYLISFHQGGIINLRNNLSQQLWIATRFLLACSFFTAIYFINKRKINPNRLVLVYFLIFSFLVSAIFYWKFFPDCYLDGVGPTNFKKISEYIIFAIFLLDSVLFFINRKKIDRTVFSYFLVAVFLSGIVELFFFYEFSYYVWGPLVFLFRLMIKIFFYKALFLVSITNPFQSFFKEIKDRETKFNSIFENINSGAVIYEPYNNGEDFIFKEVNSAVESIEKVSREKLINKKVTEVFPGAKDFGILSAMRQVYQTGRSLYLPVSFYKDNRVEGWKENFIFKLPSGEIVVIYEDITKRKIEEQNFKQNLEDLEKINHNLINREMKMIELKKKIKELEEKCAKKDFTK